MATALSTNQVTVLFNDVLFRGATVDGVTEAVVGAGEIAPWASGLDAGFFTLAQVTNSFVTSNEAMTFVDPIIRMYQAAFARAPDQGGLIYWVTQEHTAVSNGIALATEQLTIAEGFVGSAEFIADYGLGSGVNPVSLINSLYLHVLGRAADTPGLVYWEGVLGNTPTVLSEATVLMGFVNSTEFIADTQNSINSFLTAIANSALATTTATTLGTATFPTTLSLPASSFTLTTGADHVSDVTNVLGDLTPYNYNGIGPTLNSDDVITNVTNLTINDDYDTGNDILPAGVTLSSIANIILNTAGAAGEFGAPFDTTVVGGTGVQTVTINEAGDEYSYINAANGTPSSLNGATGTVGTAVTINQTNPEDGGGVEVTGGGSVTVVSAGGNTDLSEEYVSVMVGNTILGSVPTAAQVPTGAVTVTEKNTSDGAVSIWGGTNIAVTVTSTSNYGEINIGNTEVNTDDSTLGGIANPTGNVTVVDDAIYGGNVYIFGGTTVNVTASGDTIKIGDSGYWGSGDDTISAASNEATGNITVVDTAPTALSDSAGTIEDVDVRGGANISITTNTGNVHVGTDTLNPAGTALQATEPTGSVTVTDTSTYIYTHIDVYEGINPGGTAVTITASGAFIHVGAIEDGVVFAPTGNVMITNESPVVFDDIISYFNAFDTGSGYDDQWTTVIGGTNVSVTTDAGGVAIGEDSLTPLAGADPSGNVTVVDTATGLGVFSGDIAIYGGINDSVTAASGSIYVGDDSAASDPTGAVTINEAGINTGYHYYNEIEVLGGTTIVVNTTGAGDGIVVGSEEELGGTPVTGSVTITDTYSGQHHDSIAVIGGTTVSVSTTAENYGSIDVGVAPIENFAGTAVTNTADDPANVTINDSSTSSGGTVVYGQEEFNIYTNGATAVSVTGGQYAGDIIEDVESDLLSSLLPAGKSTLTTISLNGVTDSGVEVFDNALTNLNISNVVPKSGLGVYLDNTAVSSGLTVTLTNVNHLHLEDDDDTLTGTVTIDSSGSIATSVNLIASLVTAVTFDNSNTLTFDPTIPAVTTITATGSGSLILGNVSGDGALTKINATAATGAVHVELSPGTTSFAGGAGNDVVFLTAYTGSGSTETLGTGVTLSGGGGTNTIYATYDGQSGDVSLGVNPLKITGFQDLGVVGANGTYNAAGFSGLVVGNFDVVNNDFIGVNANVQFTNVEQGATLDIVDASSNTISYELATGYSAGQDAVSGGAPLAITIGQDGVTSPFLHLATAGTGDTDASVVATTATTGPDDDINTLTVNSQGYVNFINNSNENNIFGFNVNILGVTVDSTLTTVTITGDQPLFLETSGGAVTSINASGSTAALVDVIDVTTAESKSSSDSFTGGAGLFIAAADTAGGETATSKDTFTMGTGGGLITLGAGDDGSVISGGETVTLAVAVANGATVSGTTIESLTAPTVSSGTAEGTRALINNYVYGTIATNPGNNVAATTIHQLADSIAFQATATVLGNGSNIKGFEAGADGAVYQIVDGVISQTAGPAVSGTQELQDAQAILDTLAVSSGTGLGTIAMVQLPAVPGPQATFVLQYNGGTLSNSSTTAPVATAGAADTILELNALTGATGFGANPLFLEPNLLGNIGGGTSVTIGTVDIDTLYATKAGAVSEFGLTDGAGTLTGTQADDGSATANETVTTTNDKNTGAAPMGVVNIDTLLNSGTGFTTTFENLGNYGVIQAGTTGGGNLTVTGQVGADPILTLTAFTSNVILANVTYGSAADDTTMVLLADNGYTIDIATLTDASNSGTALIIAGNEDVTVGAVKDTALTVVNAADFSGFLALGTTTTPLAQPGLNIAISTETSGDGAYIVTSGAGDTIQVGYLNTLQGLDNREFGSVEIVAAGNTNTISTYTHWFEDTYIGASGTGDTINVVGSGHFGETGTFIAGTLTEPSSLQLATNDDIFSSGHYGPTFTQVFSFSNAAGAGATINIGSATADFTNADAWVGESSTVNIVDPTSGTSNAQIWVTGDTWTLGAATSQMTTINAPTDFVSNGDLSLFFYNQPTTTGGSIVSGDFEGWAGGVYAGWHASENSQVNVSGATSVTGAIILAQDQAAVINQQFDFGSFVHTTVTATSVEINAHTSLVDWFQYNGNTYIVETNNTTAAPVAESTTAVAATDVVVELTGIQDVNHINAYFA